MNPEPDDDAYLRPPYPLPFRPPASFLHSMQTLEFLVGGRGLPLCERPIPSKGTE